MNIKFEKHADQDRDISKKVKDIIKILNDNIVNFLQKKHPDGIEREDLFNILYNVIVNFSATNIISYTDYSVEKNELKKEFAIEFANKINAGIIYTIETNSDYFAEEEVETQMINNKVH
jgi:hypothetical protein